MTHANVCRAIISYLSHVIADFQENHVVKRVWIFLWATIVMSNILVLNTNLLLELQISFLLCL